MARSRSDSGGEGKPLNKSQSVRAFLAENPKAKTKEVVTQLASKGIKVDPTLVYYVKSKQKQARRRQKRERVAESSRQNAIGNPVEVVLRVKDIAREVGCIRNLKQLVDLLAE